MADRFIYKHRRGTTEQWATSDSIIYDGEIVVEKPNDGYIRLKVGDGTKKFSELPYMNIPMDSFPKELLKITVTSSDSTYSADKTDSDIKSCLDNGGIPYIALYNTVFIYEGYSSDIGYMFIDTNDGKMLCIYNNSVSLYPSNLKSKLDSTVSTTAQTLTDEQKTQARTNIGGADISLGISGATAGQMAKIKTVNESGAPTAWEAGDAAGGGSGTNGEKLLVEYVHSSNEMYQPTAFDPATGIFTCPSHGLVGNTGCFAVMNNDAAFDTTKVPKGNYGATLVPVDNDSFTINGWDYASDANVGNIDCSSFHYEHCVTFTIKDIPLYKKIRVVMLGKVFCSSWLGFDCSLLSGTLLFDTADTGSYFIWGRPGYSYGRADGIFFLDSDIFIGDNETVTTRKIWRADSNNNNKQIQNYLARKKNANTGDSITITSSYSGSTEQGFANGFVVKVYGYGGKNENSSVQ